MNCLNSLFIPTSPFVHLYNLTRLRKASKSRKTAKSFRPTNSLPEAVNSQIKVFNGVSRWRNITALLAYLQGYAIGYSFFGKSWLFK